MNDDNITKASAMIDFAYSNIEQRRFEESNKTLKYWRITLESIKSNAKNGQNLGKNLVSHSRIVDLKNGILLVEADHPAWIQTLKIYQKYILNGLRRNIPELKIESMVFRIRGSNVQIHSDDSERLTQQENEKLRTKLEEEQKIIEKFDNSSKSADSNTSTKPLPEELQKIFDRLKNDMLTDNK